MVRSLVILPTYNEAENLAALAEAILQQGPFDLLVVDDSSPDGTWAIVEHVMASYPGRVAGIRRPTKAGLGSAYFEGFQYAIVEQYDVVVQMDADRSHRPADLPRLMAALADGADLVIGSRYVPGGQTRGLPSWRAILSRAGSRYAALLLGLPFHDVTGGFKAYRRRAIEWILAQPLIARGFACQIEMTYRCHRAGLRIREVPIVFEQRWHGRSKLTGRIVLEALWLVLALRLGTIAEQSSAIFGVSLHRGNRS